MPKMLNQIIQYFDLQSERRGTAEAYAAGANLTVLPQYLALVAGIAVQPFLAEFQTTGRWNLHLAAWLSWLLFAGLTGILIFPTVYRKAFDAEQPTFVQFCAVFATGIGWKSLLTVVKALPGT
jgi:hypothetical protein